MRLGFFGCAWLAGIAASFESGHILRSCVVQDITKLRGIQNELCFDGEGLARL